MPGRTWSVWYAYRTIYVTLAVLSGLGSPAARGQSDESTVEPVVAGETSASEPLVVGVEVVGNEAVSRERILSKIKTHPNRPYLQKLVDDDVRRLFATQWFYDVLVEQRPADGGIVVVYKVVERPTILEVKFVGNKRLKEKELREITGLKAGKPMDPGLNRALAKRIEARYHEKGYPFAAVEIVEGGDRGDKNVVFQIDEGPKTKINKIDFEGNSFVSEARLRTLLQSKARILGLGSKIPGILGKYDAHTIEEDTAKLIEYYRTHGYLDVKIARRFEWTEDKSLVRVVFQIEEGLRYKVRDVRFAGNQALEPDRYSKDLKLAGGAEFNQSALTRDVQTIRDAYGSQGYINTVVNADVRYLDTPGEVDVVFQVQEDRPHKLGQVKIVGNETTKSRVIRSIVDLEPGALANTVELRAAQQRLIESRLFKTDPAQGVVPSVQFDPANDPSAEFQDVIVSVQEDQTGSLLFGVGVNSDSGLGASLVLHERNFDIARFPTSLSDVFSGQAWRGAGQEFRLEAVPGTRLQRYAVNFREPRLFGLDYSLQTSGYYFSRIFSPYDEQRVGGRFTLGKRFSRRIGAAVTYRIEDVEISEPAVPTPPDLAAVLGHNFVTSVRVAADHDTRDSHLSPGKGHYIELGYEQVFGDFDFPRVTLEGRQYFTLHTRADGSGKHVLSARGEVGYSGSQTPIFERFYAGGFSTIRGFDFRGVGPTDSGVEVGGRFQLLTGLEYEFPLTADDNLSWVFFVDAGTVERDIEILDYRVAAGFGLRVRVPGMGQVPFAFDFGFPIVKTDEDDTQIFSFFLGIFR
jgi:outer membrane protein insertion porin family